MHTNRELAFIESVIRTYGGQTVSVATLLDSGIADRGLLLSVCNVSARDYPDTDTYRAQLIAIPSN